MNSPHSLRTYRGMQVHAVPDNERAFDGSSGKRLPWGYAASGASGADENRESMEKGPFGPSQRRARLGMSRSRSKTAEPRKEEERIRHEQLAAEEAVFGNLRKIVKDDGRARETLGEVDGNAAAQQPQQPQQQQQQLAMSTPFSGPGYDGEQEAAEVLIYGFGTDLQWAALEFYERVSDGAVLEDYDRQPPGQRGLDVSRSYGRLSMQKTLSKASLRKKNRFAGGEHWIKVTFNSLPAAELACARSPHIIKGHLVYAEPYLGRGPGRDEAILASQGGAQITSEGLPNSFSTRTLNGSPNGSSTLTSATATATVGAGRQPSGDASSTTTLSANNPFASLQPVQSTTLQQQAPPTGGQLTQRRLRIEGATRAVLLPAEQALMPRQPKQSLWAWFGAREMIGTSVPRKEDGSFDWAKASLYWRLFNVIDAVLGTDLCGLKGEE